VIGRADGHAVMPGKSTVTVLQVYGWGWGRYGNLGDGHNEDRSVPAARAGLLRLFIATVSMQTLSGISNSCTLAVCFCRLLPTPVVGLDGVTVVKVGCGWRHSVAVSDAGRLYTFGWSKYGQLGHGDNA
jgi:alpha-tubulin suppressor-like RCC1 family protein